MSKVIQRVKFRVNSNSEKNKTYLVERLFGELWQCECAYNLMSGKECAHIKSVKNEEWLKNLT